MPSITAFKFDSPDGAKRMLDLVQELEKGQLVGLEDVAMVSWEPGNNNPKTSDLDATVGDGALSGAFWGMLFGLIFFTPNFGMAFAASTGALAGKFSNYGISKYFISSLQNAVTEGSSALFLMSSDAVKDLVAKTAKQKGLEFEIVTTDLNTEQLGQLQRDFGIK